MKRRRVRRGKNERELEKGRVWVINRGRRGVGKGKEKEHECALRRGEGETNGMLLNYVSY